MPRSTIPATSAAWVSPQATGSETSLPASPRQVPGVEHHGLVGVGDPAGRREERARAARGLQPAAHRAVAAVPRGLGRLEGARLVAARGVEAALQVPGGLRGALVGDELLPGRVGGERRPRRLGGGDGADALEQVRLRALDLADVAGVVAAPGQAPAGLGGQRGALVGVLAARAAGGARLLVGDPEHPGRLPGGGERGGGDQHDQGPGQDADDTAARGATTGIGAVVGPEDAIDQAAGGGVVAGIGAVLTGRPGLAFPEQHRPDIMPLAGRGGRATPGSGRIDGDRRAPGGPRSGGAPRGGSRPGSPTGSAEGRDMTEREGDDTRPSDGRTEKFDTSAARPTDKVDTSAVLGGAAPRGRTTRPTRTARAT